MPLVPWQRRRSVPPEFTSLDTHPNRDEIVAIRRRAAVLRDVEITRLALGWRNTPYLATVRAKALTPDSPLIIEVLAAFDAVDTAFDEVLARHEQPSFAEPSSWTLFSASPATPPTAAQPSAPVSLHPSVIEIALKSVRDALAAAYARPVLRRGEYAGLIAPWRRVFPPGLHATP
jgi:hypothetical protein